MNCFNRFLASLITMAALLGLTQGDVKAATRPNVVLIMTDDQGYGDIAALGNPWLRTPNIDRLYGESVRFTNFHVDPTCAPTRSALVTGRYSTRTGCWHTIMGRSLIFHDEVLMPKFFKEAGYATGIFGKWHLGDNYPMRPHDLGFDMAVVTGGGGVGQTLDWWGNDWRTRGGRAPRKQRDRCVYIESARSGQAYVTGRHGSSTNDRCAGNVQPTSRRQMPSCNS